MTDPATAEPLARLIEAIKRNLSEGRYRNESAVREALVLPIFQRLGWDTIDPYQVRREHPIGSRKVDYALFVRQTTPDLLVEVKAVGAASGGDRQLFEYAFHEGVPMALLTDGQEWSFYLPTERGNYEDRRLYTLDLQARPGDECCRVLTRYLDFDRVKQNQAISDARKDYESAARERIAAQTVSNAWLKLVEEPDGLLIDLLIEKTQALCGYDPSREQVEAFLSKLVPHGQGTPAVLIPAPRPAIPPFPPGERRRRPDGGRPADPTQVVAEPLLNGPKPLAPHPVRTTGSRAIRVTLDGQTHLARDAITGLIEVIRHLAAKDDTFLERLEIRARGRTRNHVARSKEEVHPQRSDLIDYAVEVVPGWFLDTNISNREKLRLLIHSCEVAGVERGKGVDLDLE